MQRILLSIPKAGLEQFDQAVKVASTMRPGLTRSAAIREAMILWQLSVIPQMAAAIERAAEILELSKPLTDLEEAS